MMTRPKIQRVICFNRKKEDPNNRLPLPIFIEFFE
jgi:hypothetical protein